MNAHRLTIKIASVICSITLVASFFITLYSTSFLDNWFTCILSLVVGLFTSSLIILVGSVVGLTVRKREVASSYMLPMSQLNTEIDLLRLFFTKHHIALDATYSYHEEFSKLEVIFSLLAEKYTTLLLIERMSWVSQKYYDHHISVLSKQGLPYIECTFKKLSAQAASSCTIILALLKRYPLYSDSNQFAELFAVLRDQLAKLNDLISPEGEYDECIKKFKNIRLKILKIPCLD